MGSAAKQASSGLRELELIVPGMGSDHCAGIISKTITRLDGIDGIKTNIAKHRVSVRSLASGPDGDAVKRAVEGAGYDVASVREVGATTLRVTVPGMGSDHCAGIIKSTLARHDGVQSTSTNISNHTVSVVVGPEGPSEHELKKLIEGAGYDVAAIALEGETNQEEDSAVEEAYLKLALRRFWIAAIPTTLIMLLMMPHMFWQSIPGYLVIVAALGFPVVFLYGGAATHKASWRSLKNGTFNMDVLISMGSLPPYLIGLVGFVYPMTSFIEMAATIMTFHMLGRYLEAKAKGKASEAIRKLLTLGAKTARVERGGEEVEIPVKELTPGDVMIIRPGDKVPTDGEVVEGESHVDESIATGESVPVYKSSGDTVIGATINKEGRLRVKATRVGGDTFLAQVVKLIDEAQGSRVPIQEFADRMTGRFVPLVLIIALGSLVAWLLAADSLRPVLEWGGRFPAVGRPDGCHAGVGYPCRDRRAGDCLPLRIGVGNADCTHGGVGRWCRAGYPDSLG